MQLTDWVDFSKWPYELLAFFVVCIGLCVGSFLNVVIVRLPRGRSIVTPSSRCGFCRSAISRAMNLPIVGFLLSRGMCSKCGHAFSVRYPVIEALNAILYFVVFSIYGWTLSSLVFSLFTSALLAMSFIDLEFKIIPDSISLGGWALATVVAALGFSNYPIDLIGSVLGGLAGYGSFWVLSRAYSFIVGEEGLGGGDVKLMGFIGALLGIKGVVVTILVGSLLGTVVGIIFIFGMKKTKKFPIPFGPFLALGALAAVFQIDLLWWP